MQPRERFGANLRRQRLERGMSQEDLGFSAGLHPTEVSRLERATREPRLGTIVKLARALGMKPGELLDEIA